MHFGIPGTYNQPGWNEMGKTGREWHVQMQNTLTDVSLAKLRFFAHAPTPTQYHQVEQRIFHLKYSYSYMYTPVFIKTYSRSLYYLNKQSSAYFIYIHSTNFYMYSNLCWQAFTIILSFIKKNTERVDINCTF